MADEDVWLVNMCESIHIKLLFDAVSMMKKKLNRHLEAKF
jgi:hypothetical protein